MKLLSDFGVHVSSRPRLPVGSRVVGRALGATLVVVGLYVFSGTSADAGAGGRSKPLAGDGRRTRSGAGPGGRCSRADASGAWKAFDTLPGVISTTSGYAGGMIQGPSYKECG